MTQEVLPGSSSAPKHNRGLRNDHRLSSMALLDLERTSALADESFCHCVGKFLPDRYLQLGEEEMWNTITLMTSELSSILKAVWIANRNRF